MSVVFVTFDISKDDRLSEVKEEQLEIIYLISVTLPVLKFERLRLVKESQQNMHDISVTLLVLKFPKEIDVKFVSLFASNALLNTIFEIFHKKIDIFARLV